MHTRDAFKGWEATAVLGLSSPGEPRDEVTQRGVCESACSFWSEACTPARVRVSGWLLEWAGMLSVRECKLVEDSEGGRVEGRWEQGVGG